MAAYTHLRGCNEQMAAELVLPQCRCEPGAVQITRRSSLGTDNDVEVAVASSGNVVEGRGGRGEELEEGLVLDGEPPWTRLLT